MASFEKDVAMKAWARFIYDVLNEWNISQGLLAEILGVKRHSITYWLNGKQVPTLTTMFMVCERLGKDFTVSAEYMRREREAEYGSRV